MRKLLFIIFIINSIDLKGSELISAYDFQEIYSLYFDQQYEVVKAKMKSYGYELQSEIPPYSYNNVSYMGEFTFIKRCTERVYVQGDYEVTRTTEFKFKASCEGSFINSRIDFKSESSKPESYFIKNIMDIWLKEIPTNRAINTDAKFLTEKQLMIADTLGVCGKTDADNVVLRCVKPSKDYRIFLEKGNEVYSKFWGFMINTRAMYPVDNIDLYLANYKRSPQDRITIKLNKNGSLYCLTINVGGVYLNYFVDSGASEMSINKSTVDKLIRNGKLSTANYLPSQQYTLADGTVKTYKRILLNNLKLGNLTFNSVSAYICDDTEPLLLGQSFFKKFGVWQINNNKSTFECVKKL